MLWKEGEIMESLVIEYIVPMLWTLFLSGFALGCVVGASVAIKSYDKAFRRTLGMLDG